MGQTGGALGGPNKGSVDAWVIKYDRSGRVLWKLQPGTDGADSANAVATGKVYVVGHSAESPPSCCNDAWVMKYNADGRLLWKRRFASSGDESASGVATDKDGNVYVVGATQGELFLRTIFLSTPGWSSSTAMAVRFGSFNSERT